MLTKAIMSDSNFVVICAPTRQVLRHVKEMFMKLAPKPTINMMTQDQCVIGKKRYRFMVPSQMQVNQCRGIVDLDVYCDHTLWEDNFYERSKVRAYNHLVILAEERRKREHLRKAPDMG